MMKNLKVNVMGVEAVEGKKLSRVVYENKAGERKVYRDMVVDTVNSDRIIVKQDTGEFKTFVFDRILAIK